ncbi:hypothetical protein EBR96_08340, partial [bacterium]|nr:hypothetical protein [bacterium]
TIEEFVTAFRGAISDPEIKNTYYSTANVTNALLQVVNNGSTSNVRRIYAVYDGSATENVSMPIGLKSAFPANRRWSLPINASQVMTIPQTVFILQQSGLMDGAGLPEEIRRSGHAVDPYSMLKRLGLLTVQTNRVYIVSAWLNALKTYKPTGGTWSQVDALESQVEVYYEGDAGLADRAVLEYPKASGTGTIELQVESGRGTGPSALAVKSKGGFISKLINSYHRAIGTASASPHNLTYRLSPWSQTGEPVYVTDFVSGTATLKILDSSNAVLASMPIKILKIDADPVQILNPRGMDAARVAATGWDPDFEPQEIAAGEGESVYIDPEWTPVNIDVPSGYTLAYAVSLGKSLSKVEWDQPMNDRTGTSWDFEQQGGGYKWKNIWSTWENNRFIYTTHVRVPVALASTPRSTLNNYQVTYEISVTPVLIETTSGRVAWRGSEGRTNFRVGSPPPWNVALRGTIRFDSSRFDQISSAMGTRGVWKIGLFKRGGIESGRWVDAFWTTGPKSPVKIGETTPVVAILGTTAEIKTGGYQVSYTMPTFSKTTNPMSRNSQYGLVVWFDYDSDVTSPGAQWGTYGAPTNGSLDTSNQAFLEAVIPMNGTFWSDPLG